MREPSGIRAGTVTTPLVRPPALIWDDLGFVVGRWNLQQINKGPNLIYLLDDQNVKRSDDGGKTWQVDVSLENQLTGARRIPIRRAETDAFDVVLTDMQFDPINPLRRFAVGKGGAFFTNDGVNWDRLLDTGALSGRPTNCYYDWVSNPSERALYVAFAGRSVVKISPLP
jgi:hypothetical protein